MRNIMKKLAGNRNGATAIEYGLIAGFVAIAIVAALTTTGTNLTTLFGNANTDIASAGNAGAH
jgi:pilus assembly protein Flp/PilA